MNYNNPWCTSEYKWKTVRFKINMQVAECIFSIAAWLGFDMLCFRHAISHRTTSGTLCSAFSVRDTPLGPPTDCYGSPPPLVHIWNPTCLTSLKRISPRSSARLTDSAAWKRQHDPQLDVSKADILVFPALQFTTMSMYSFDHWCPQQGLSETKKKSSKTRHLLLTRSQLSLVD